MGHLRGDVDRQPVVVGAGWYDENRVGLHRHDRDALVLEPTPDDDVGVRKRIGAPLSAADREVGAQRVDQNGRARCERGFGVGHGGQRLVVDDDRLGRVDTGGPALGRDHHDRVPHEEHLALGQGGTNAEVVQLHERWDRRKAEVRSRRHRGDAGHPGSLGGVDRPDPCVRNRGPHEREVQDAVDGEVVHIGGPTGQEVGVLDAEHDVSEQRSGHLRTLCRSPAAP